MKFRQACHKCGKPNLRMHGPRRLLRMVGELYAVNVMLKLHHESRKQVDFITPELRLLQHS